MKRKPIFLFSGVIALCLSACSGVKHDMSDYILELPYKSDYRILQLTDTHIGDKDNCELHYKFMDLTIKEANPDLIVITGDVFTFASRHTAKEFFSFLDSYEVPWTLTFGNHDEQCFFSIDWLTSELNTHGGYCVFKDVQDDDVQGNANFAINLMKDDKAFEQLIIMDSNRYNYNGYFGYDYFKEDQIKWYEDLVDYTEEQNGGLVQSLMFYHIPLPEVNDAWEAAKKYPDIIKNPENAKEVEAQENEKPCNPEFNSGFFNVIEKKGSTKGMYFGHDHINNFIVHYRGVDFGYGIKATDRVYYEEPLLGGRVITIKDDHSLEYTDYYHSYQEVL